MPHGDFHPIIFVIVAVWVLVCGVGVVAFRNIVHSAMILGYPKLRFRLGIRRPLAGVTWA